MTKYFVLHRFDEVCSENNGVNEKAQSKRLERVLRESWEKAERESWKRAERLLKDSKKTAKRQQEESQKTPKSQPKDSTTRQLKDSHPLADFNSQKTAERHPKVSVIIQSFTSWRFFSSDLLCRVQEVNRSCGLLGGSFLQDEQKHLGAWLLTNFTVHKYYWSAEAAAVAVIQLESFTPVWNKFVHYLYLNKAASLGDMHGGLF